jgi:20S proteasome subunit beta 3
LEDGKPVIATYDSIGCTTDSENFAVGGTASEFLYGLCESYYKPDLSADDLTEVISQILTSGADRDALAGWGGVAYIL